MSGKVYLIIWLGGEHRSTGLHTVSLLLLKSQPSTSTCCQAIAVCCHQLFLPIFLSILFQWKSFSLWYSFSLYVRNLLTFYVPLNQSQENRVRGYVLVHFCTEAAMRRPQDLLWLLDNCNICESSKKTHLPLSSAYEISNRDWSQCRQ